MTTERRYTTDRPWPYPRGRAALIDQVINAYQYVLCFDDGTREPGYFSGHRELVVGERVRAFASRELHAWEIQLLGANAEETFPGIDGFVALGWQNQSNITGVLRLLPYSTENGWGSNVSGQTGTVPRYRVADVRWSPDGKYLGYVSGIGDTGTQVESWGVYEIDDTGYVSQVFHRQRSTFPEEGGWCSFAWSPDGNFIARRNVDIDAEELKLSVYSFSESGVTLVDEVSVDDDFEAVGNWSAIKWSRDGSLIAIGTGNRAAQHVLAVVPWNGSNLGSPSYATDFPTSHNQYGVPNSVDWSADGNWVFAGFSPNKSLYEDDQHLTLLAYPVANDGSVGSPVIAPDSRDHVGGVEVSPDGSMVAVIHAAPTVFADPNPPRGIAIHQWADGQWGASSFYSIGLGVAIHTASVAWLNDEWLFAAGKFSSGSSGATVGVFHIVDGAVDGEPVIGAGAVSGITGASVHPRPTMTISVAGGGGPLAPVDTDDVVYTPPTPGSGNTPPGGSLGGVIDDLLGSPSYPIPGGVTPHEDRPWELYFPVPVGFCSENPTCTEEYTVQGSGATAVSNLRAAAAEGGVCIFVPDGMALNFGSTPLSVNSHTAIIGLGRGWAYTGTNTGIRINNKHHVLLRNFAINDGGTLHDGINATGPGADMIRIDQFSGNAVIDETIDFWKGTGRSTITRAHFPRQSHYGLLMGLSQEDSQAGVQTNTRCTIYECVFESDGRQPLVTGNGWWHMVNNVHPRWGYECIHARWFARVRVEREWFGPSASASRPAFQSPEGGGHIIQTGSIFDRVANPGNIGSQSFTPPYGALGTPMSPARRDQILHMVGAGTLTLNLSLERDLRLREEMGLTDSIVATLS